MAPIYRTAGAWGAGKGANLTPAEVDGNFYDHEQRITDLEVNPPEGVGIVSFTVTGTRFTVNMSDGSTQGPFTLPTAAFRWSDAWTPGTAYEELDVFSYQVGGEDDGIYLVLGPYTAPEITTENPTPILDPAVSDTNGPLLEKMLGIVNPPSIGSVVVVNVVDADLVLGDEDSGSYFRMNSAAPHTVGVEAEATVPYGVGATFAIRQVGAGTVTLVGLGTDTIIHPPFGFTLALRGPGASAALVYAGGDEWDASGDLVPEPATV